MRLIVVIFALFVSSGIFSQISQPLCFDYDGGGAGAFVGGVGGGASGIIAGTGNALYFQDADLADALGQGLKEGAIGFGSGILLGGVIGYLTTPQGYNPMNGKLKPGGRLVSASYDDIIELCVSVKKPTLGQAHLVFAET